MTTLCNIIQTNLRFLSIVPYHIENNSNSPVFLQDRETQEGIGGYSNREAK